MCLKWNHVCHGEYRSGCGRWIIERIPFEENDYNDQDEWLLYDGYVPVEVFPYIYDAKRFAEEMARLGDEFENS